MEWTTDNWPQQVNMYDKVSIYSSMTNFRVKGYSYWSGGEDLIMVKSTMGLTVRLCLQSEMTEGSASECLQAWTPNPDINYKVIYTMELCILWLLMVSHWYFPNKWTTLMGVCRELRLGKTIAEKTGEESKAEAQGRH